MEALHGGEWRVCTALRASVTSRPYFRVWEQELLKFQQGQKDAQL